MSEPLRIQLSRKRGWRMPPNSVGVARPSRFGNPFKVKDVGREEAINKFRAWLIEDIYGKTVAADAKAYLKGKNLGCFCKIGTACHADILLEIANS